MPIISIIVALDNQNAIGKGNRLLCHLPADLHYFKHVTEGHSIIMGRHTFESLPNGALPNRRNIVLTRQNQLSWLNVDVCRSLDNALLLTENEQEVFVIGGGSLYKESIELAHRLYVTQIHHTFDEADTFFPEINMKEWKLVSRKDHKADEKNKFDFSFLIYEKI